MLKTLALLAFFIVQSRKYEAYEGAPTLDGLKKGKKPKPKCAAPRPEGTALDVLRDEMKTTISKYKDMTMEEKKAHLTKKTDEALSKAKEWRDTSNEKRKELMEKHKKEMESKVKDMKAAADKRKARWDALSDEEKAKQRDAMIQNKKDSLAKAADKLKEKGSGMMAKATKAGMGAAKGAKETLEKKLKEKLPADGIIEKAVEQMYDMKMEKRMDQSSTTLVMQSETLTDTEAELVKVGDSGKGNKGKGKSQKGPNKTEEERGAFKYAAAMQKKQDMEAWKGLTDKEALAKKEGMEAKKEERKAQYEAMKTMSDEEKAAMKEAMQAEREKMAQAKQAAMAALTEEWMAMSAEEQEAWKEARKAEHEEKKKAHQKEMEEKRKAAMGEMPEEKRAAMQEKKAAMEKKRAEMKEKWDNMSDEERAAMEEKKMGHHQKGKGKKMPMKDDWKRMLEEINMCKGEMKKHVVAGGFKLKLRDTADGPTSEEEGTAQIVIAATEAVAAAHEVPADTVEILSVTPATERRRLAEAKESQLEITYVISFDDQAEAQENAEKEVGETIKEALEELTAVIGMNSEIVGVDSMPPIVTGEEETDFVTDADDKVGGVLAKTDAEVAAVEEAKTEEKAEALAKTEAEAAAVEETETSNAAYLTSFGVAIFLSLFL